MRDADDEVGGRIRVGFTVTVRVSVGMRVRIRIRVRLRVRLRVRVRVNVMVRAGVRDALLLSKEAIIRDADDEVRGSVLWLRLG